MARISKTIKDDVVYYANHKEVNLLIAELCNSRKEIDAVYKCELLLKHNRLLYLKAKYNAPHNVSANKKAHNKALEKSDSEEELLDIFMILIELYPLSNKTLLIKKELNTLCEDILREAKIGKKRIEKIIPLLTKHTLMDEEEEFDGLELWWSNIEKKLNL